MSPLLAPVLAQLVTLGVGDGTEARAVYSEGTRTTEGSTSPIVGLTVDWRRFGISASYYPSLTLIPLVEKPRELLVSHAASLGLSYRQRFQRTSLTISETASFTQNNLHETILGPPPPASAGPTPPPTGGMGGSGGMGGTGGTSGTGGTGGTGNQPSSPEIDRQPTERAFDRVVRYGSLTTAVRVEQYVSSVTTAGGEISYTVSSGLDDATRADYPLVTSESALGFVTHRLSRRDTVDGSIVIQHAAAPDDTVAWVTTLGATYHHQFGPRTDSHAGLGLASTLTQLPTDVDIVSIYPTFNTGVAHWERVGRSMLSMHAEASSGPVLDYYTALVDPRIGIGTGVTWSLEDWSMYASASSSISTNGDADAFNNINGNAGMTYAIGAGFSVNTGIRAAWQTLGDVTLVPPSWAVFVGVSWGAAIPIRRRQ
jgi:hypothetical protein